MTVSLWGKFVFWTPITLVFTTFVINALKQGIYFHIFQLESQDSFNSDSFFTVVCNRSIIVVVYSRNSFRVHLACVANIFRPLIKRLKDVSLPRLFCSMSVVKLRGKKIKNHILIYHVQKCQLSFDLNAHKKTFFHSILVSGLHFPPKKVLPPFAIKKSRFNFADEFKVGDVRYKHLTQITIKVQLFWRLAYEM